MAPTFADPRALRIAALAAIFTVGCSSRALAQRAPVDALTSASPDVAHVGEGVVDPLPLSGPDGEDFETFDISSVLGQNGWFPFATGAFIQDRNNLSFSFGHRSIVLPSFGLTVPYGAQRHFGEPRSMRFEADFILSGAFTDVSQGASLDVSNTDVQTFNTRIVLRRWENDSSGGDISVFQVLTAEQGVFIDTGVDWRIGSPIRLGVEVLAGRGVHVTVNGQHVFAGHDIASELGRGDAGVNRLAFRLSGGLMEVAVDNVLHVDAIASDLTRDGVVDNSDLALLLGQWGTSEGRTDLDQSGSVDGPDLAILLAEWSN